MSDEFNIEMEQYTPPPSYETEASLPSPSSDWPSESRYATDYYTEQAISSSLNDANSSASGWINTVANLLPGIAGVVKSFIPSKQSSPLPITQGGTPQNTINGISGQARLPSGTLAQQTKTSSNTTLFLLIGGAVFLLYFMMKRG